MRKKLIVGIAWIAAGGTVSLHGQIQPKTTPEPPKILRFAVLLNRIFPQEMTVEEGQYIIYVENGAYTDQLDIQVDDDHATRLASKTIARNTSKARMILELKPGKLTLTIAGKPKLTVGLEVIAAKEKSN